MLPRLVMLPRLAGVSRRMYSSDAPDKSLFLANLLLRIDKINTKKQAEPAKTPARKPRQVKTAKNVFDGHQGKVAVKDHPLSRNTFKMMDESNFRSGAKANPPSRQEGAKARPPRARGTRPPRARTAPRAPKEKNAGAKSVVAKSLVVTNYQPTINGDAFFYGKPTSVAISTSSRVAAVAKEALLESKYPYKLPKSIIDKLDDSYEGNKFIAQKDFNLDVDEAHLGDRISKVVKGQVDTIVMGNKPDATAVFTAAQLARNGDLSLSQQQTIYDVASGLKSAKLLVEGAAWNK